jgi:hypothetical protein
MGVTPDAIRQLLDELEANSAQPQDCWATLQRLRKFLEAKWCENRHSRGPQL